MPDVPGDSHRPDQPVAGSSRLHAANPATGPTVNLRGRATLDVPCPVSLSCGSTDGRGLSNRLTGLKARSRCARWALLPGLKHLGFRA